MFLRSVQSYWFLRFRVHRALGSLLFSLSYLLGVGIWSPLVGDDVIRYELSPMPVPSDLPGVLNFRPGRDEPNLLGDRVSVGITWYDYQSNGTLTKLIAVDEDGGVHIVWTKGFNNDWAAGERHTFYNYVVDGEPQFDGGVAVDNLPRGGFCNIAYSPTWGAVPFFHATVDGVIWTHFAVDEELGAGEFSLVRPPRLNDGNEYIWPRGAVDGQGRVHVIARMRNDPGTPVNLMYVRATFDEENNEWQFTEPRSLRQLKGLSYAIVASPVSDKVAIIYPAPAYPEGENNRWNGAVGEAAANNNLIVFESANGVDFPWDDPINVTQVLRPNPNADRNSPFYQGDTLRPAMFVDGCYDNDDNLHIVFSTVVLWEATDPNANPGWVAGRYDEKRNLIWHWDRESGQISLVASARYNTDGTVGNWRQNISFPSIGVDEDNNLYCVFTLYPERGDRAANGQVSGEIYATVSVDGGATWAVPINLTETHSQNAQAGECQSESWSSLAARVTDNLHIAYILDRDAGGIPQGEGVATENPVMYHWVPREEIPTEPRILGRDFHVGYPARIALNRNEISAIAVPDGEPVREEIVIRNTNEDGLGLHITLIPSEEIGGVVRLDPPAVRIPPGGEISVGVIFAPEEVGIVEGEIALHHTGSNVASPIQISFTGIGTPGFGGLRGRVTDLREGFGVEQAVITLRPGNYTAFTDREGNYEFERIPAFQYSLTCEHPEYLVYSDSVVIEPEEWTVLNIPLRFATFELSREAVEISIAQNEEFDLHFTAVNRGNGTLEYRARLEFPGGDIEPWTPRWSLAAGDSTGDSRIVAATFIGDRFYVAGGNSGQDINYIYVFDREGHLTGRFEQPARSAWGMRDLAWDGQLLWGGDGRVLYGFDREGNLVRSINTPLNPVRAVAWDPDDSLFWICDLRSPIYGINPEGHEVARFSQPDTTRINGLAWWKDDPDGYALYAFSSNENIGHPCQIYKIDPTRRFFRPLVDLEAPGDARAGGIEFSTDWDPYNLVLIATLQMRSDGITIYQVAPRTDWVRLVPTEGEIPAGEEEDFTLSFNTQGMPVEAQFEVRVLFDHTGRGHHLELPVVLTITAEGGLTQREMAMELGWSLVSLNLEPDNPQISAIFSPLIDNGTLLMVKDDEGRFTNARLGWEFPDWNPAKGYWVKTSSPGRVVVSGTGIPFDRPIPLRRGWQTISYYPRTPTDVRVALSGLGENLIAAKDEKGRFYLPAYDFSNMPSLREGKGYLIKVAEGGELIYRLGGGGLMADLPPQPLYYKLAETPPQSMSLLVLNLPQWVKEVGVWTRKGVLLGAGCPDLKGRAGVSVWGGEEGWCVEGDPITLSVWDGERELPLSLKIIEGDLSWGDNKITVGEALGLSVPRDVQLLTFYPNPFNDQGVIRFYLRQQGNIKLTLFDLQGRVVRVLFQGHLEEGSHRLTVSREALPAGIYLLSLNGTDFTLTQKLVILR